MGAFAPSVGPSSEPQQRTGFCAYSQKYIDKLFDQNIHMCFNGSMQYRNLPYISGINSMHFSFYKKSAKISHFWSISKFSHRSSNL